MHRQTNWIYTEKEITQLSYSVKDKNDVWIRDRKKGIKATESVCACQHCPFKPHGLDIITPI
jgi:hypothetical protein